MNLFDKCERFLKDPAYAASLGLSASPTVVEAMGLYPYFIPLDDTEGTTVCVRGKRMVMIGSNNYLGLTTDPRVRKAAQDAIAEFGTSCTGSRFLNGTLAMHQELEQRLARFLGKEDAVVFTTGYQANLGTISSLLGRGDVVICDKEDHASILDGCRLSLGRLMRYRHNDIEDLERVLRACPSNAGVLVVVDGVFSMEGDLAPLPEIVELCRTYGARLLVDDAHGIGVTGGGRGTAMQYGVLDEVDLIVGTFSKALASVGGFVAGEASVIHWIRHRARSLIFSASLPPSSTAAAFAALEILEAEPQRVDRVNAIAEQMRNAYRAMGLDVGASATPIVPIIVGDTLEALKLWKALFEAGVYTNVAMPPAVPDGKSLLRTSYMATHKQEHMDQVLQVLSDVLSG